MAAITFARAYEYASMAQKSELMEAASMSFETQDILNFKADLQSFDYFQFWSQTLGVDKIQLLKL